MAIPVATHISTTALGVEDKIEITVSFEFQPEEQGYLGRCPELDAVAWGRTLDETKEADFNLDPKLKYAKVITSYGTKRQIKKLLGL